MSRRHESPGALTMRLWERLRPLPGGRALFTLALAWMAPYSASIGPRVEELRPGHARIAIRDRRAVRNHLASVHALALANLGELTSGLAMMSALPATVRGIVTGLAITYAKKARGTITAEADVTVPHVTTDTAHVVEAILRDAAGDEVARVRVDWKLGPVT